MTQVAPLHRCSGATFAELRPLLTGRSDSQVAALVKGLPRWNRGSGFFIAAMYTYIELVKRYGKRRHVIFIAWLLPSPSPAITKAEMDAHRKELKLMSTSGGLHH